MEDLYTKEKAKGTARALARSGVDFQTAFRVTERVWEEARRAIARIVSAEEWRRLSFSDKAFVCQMVIRGLLDRKRLIGSLNGERKSIL